MALITSAFGYAGLEEAREPQHLTLQLNSRVWGHHSLGIRILGQTPGSLHRHIVTFRTSVVPLGSQIQIARALGDD